MATNIDTAVAAATALDLVGSPHVFTMSNGDLVVFYKEDGTNGWGYRVKHGGTWGSFVALSNPGSLTHLNMARAFFTRNGDTLYAVGGTATGTTEHGGFWKLVYSTGTQLFTQSTYDTDANTGTNAALTGIYYDSTNGFVHTTVNVPSAGSYLIGINPTTMAMITGGAGSVQVTGSIAFNETNFVTLASYCITLVGTGTNTFYFILYDPTNAANAIITRITYAAAAYSQVAETGVPVLSAVCRGITAVYDGTNIDIFLNENSAKLRRTRRTAINTYDAMADLDANTLSGAPASCALANGDVVVFYERTSAQANGEVYYIDRLGGTWGAATRLAGGAATGWSSPTTAPSDLNDTVGVARVVYLTGTANPWTLVEDSVSTVSSGGGGARASNALAIVLLRGD